MGFTHRPPVLHLPVSASLAAVAAHAERENPDPNLLLSVGRITSETDYKGWHDIALAVASLRVAHSQLRWQVVGDGDGLDALRARCQALGIADSVDFMRGVTDEALAELYQRAYLFVLPSVADPDAKPPVGEGFGLVYAEAGAFGVPSIGSDQGGGALDFVKDGRTGLTVPLHSPDALAASISSLIGDRRERDRLGQAARELAMTEHSQERFARRLAGLVGPRLDNETVSTTPLAT
jgi:glycosyltransferase involved in cell wall biosynthesis